MKKSVAYVLLMLISILFSSPLWAQGKRMEVFLVSDSSYTPPIDGIFIDLDSYLSITYELDKIEILKIELPAIQDSLNHMRLVRDSATVAHLTKTKHLTSIVRLERQSKKDLKIRVINLQHNYNVMEAKAFKWRRQRNGVTIVSLGLVLIKVGLSLLK